MSSVSESADEEVSVVVSVFFGDLKSGGPPPVGSVVGVAMTTLEAALFRQIVNGFGAPSSVKPLRRLADMVESRHADASAWVSFGDIVSLANSCQPRLAKGVAVSAVMALVRYSERYANTGIAVVCGDCRSHVSERCVHISLHDSEDTTDLLFDRHDLVRFISEERHLRVRNIGKVKIELLRFIAGQLERKDRT